MEQSQPNKPQSLTSLSALALLTDIAVGLEFEFVDVRQALGYFRAGLQFPRPWMPGGVIKVKGLVRRASSPGTTRYLFGKFAKVNGLLSGEACFFVCQKLGCSAGSHIYFYFSVRCRDSPGAVQRQSVLVVNRFFPRNAYRAEWIWF